MTRRAWRKDPADVLAEARRPGPSLLLMTGLRPTYFAYPFGVAAPEAEDAVKKAGYDWAFLADERFAWVNLADPTLDHWAVPRTIVYRWSRENLFKLLEARARTRN
jgi:peptidoglycan/xylan/chitin deacetylase (PgdA/CDA1 family)